MSDEQNEIENPSPPASPAEGPSPPQASLLDNPILTILALCGVTMPTEKPCGLCKGRILQPAKIEVLGIELPGFRFCPCRYGREMTLYGELLKGRGK